jgi:hypothetical protein
VNYFVDIDRQIKTSSHSIEQETIMPIIGLSTGGRGRTPLLLQNPAPIDGPIPVSDAPATISTVMSQIHAGGGGSREVINGFRDGSNIDQEGSAVLAQEALDRQEAARLASITTILKWVGGGLILLLVVKQVK